MNKALEEKLSRYYKEILSAIPCERKKKAAFMSEFQAQIEEFTESSPDTDIEEIISVFGSPEEIAEGFIKELAGDEIKRKLSVKRILVFFISAVLLIWAVFAVVSLIDVHSDSHGYFTEEILHIQNIWGGGAL